MRNHLSYFILLLLIIISFQTFAVESSATPPENIKKELSTNPSHQSFNKKNWEVRLGRKLNFKERISLRLFQKQLKKQAKKSQQNDGESPDGFALAGMIAGLLGVLLSILLIPLGAFITGVIAIIISAIGKNKTEGLEGFRKKGRKMAVTGLVLGIIVTAFWLGILAIALAVLGS